MNRLDDLHPILRTVEPDDPFVQVVVNLPIGKSGLGLYLAHTNWTPRNTVGTLYVMNRDVDALGKSAVDLLVIACENLMSGLQIDGVEIAGEQAFLVKHPMGVGASAIGLPDFYEKASGWADSDELFVGFPDPSVLFVAAVSNTNAIAQMREAIVTSNYWGGVTLTPACYRLTVTGLELIAARESP